MNMIEQRIRDFLKLRKPPQHLTGDHAALEALIAQIVKIVEDRKPADNVEAWVGEVIERAMIKQKGSAWPSADVWAIAVGAASQRATRAHKPPTDMSGTERAYQALVRAIQNDQPVAEPMLFSRLAERALREGLISFGDLRAYQRSAFIARREFYGAPAAFKWLDEMNPALAQDMRDQREAAERELRPQHASDEERDLMGGEIDV